MKSSMTSIRVIYVHREREKVDFKSREVNCLKECALALTRVSAFCTKCLHRPIVIINQQYTKGEIHFIYLHYFHVFGFCFIDRYHGNGCVSLENPTVCTVNGRA